MNILEPDWDLAPTEEVEDAKNGVNCAQNSVQAFFFFLSLNQKNVKSLTAQSDDDQLNMTVWAIHSNHWHPIKVNYACLLAFPKNIVSHVHIYKSKQPLLSCSWFWKWTFGLFNVN